MKKADFTASLNLLYNNIMNIFSFFMAINFNYLYGYCNLVSVTKNDVFVLRMQSYAVFAMCAIPTNSDFYALKAIKALES